MNAPFKPENHVAITKRAPTSGESPPSTPTATFVTAAEFCRAYEPISYAIEPFVRSGSLYTVTAKTGSGKTGLLVSSALAVVTGNGEMILGREVTKGRVAYIAAENPDDLRMRIMVAASLLNIDLDKAGSRFEILDKRMSPEELLVRLTTLSADGHGPFTLIMVDTLAAFFDGDNINDPVQGGNFMRKLRPLTMLPGRPSVLVAAHPTKNASDDGLVPYGAGAILNEVDGNLTLRREGEITNLHWQGKLRGIEFAPALFKFEIAGCPAVKDIKGREVQLPVLTPCQEGEFEKKQTDEVNKDAAVLRAMIEMPGATWRDWATRSGVSKTALSRCLEKLRADKLVEKTLNKWSVTAKGRKAITPHVEGPRWE
jgi:hypothetical protein